MIKQAGYIAGVVGPICLALSQAWSAHEETERARIEAERADRCEYDYRSSAVEVAALRRNDNG